MDFIFLKVHLYSTLYCTPNIYTYAPPKHVAIFSRPLLIPYVFCLLKRRLVISNNSLTNHRVIRKILTYQIIFSSSYSNAKCNE